MSHDLNGHLSAGWKRSGLELSDVSDKARRPDLEISGRSLAGVVIDFYYDDHHMTGADIALLSSMSHPDMPLICFSSAVDPPRLHVFDSFLAKADGVAALADSLYAHLFADSDPTEEAPPQ